MKGVSSSLNPYAAPFIPISRQSSENVDASSTRHCNSNIDYATEIDQQVAETETKDSYITFEDYNEPHHQLRGIATEETMHISNEGLPVSGDSFIGNNDHNYEDSDSCKAYDWAEKPSLIEGFELDLAYLAAAFPSISEQSLVDVYYANSGDLEASVDMLIQLEDSNILDISEPGSADDLSRMLKITPHGEASESFYQSCSTSSSELH